jgi:cellulose biosynthesis protein BcsQ
MSLIIAFLARKGGVGKTTYSENLAAALARAGLYTVFVEADGQGNASEHMRVRPHDGFNQLILHHREWSDVLIPVPETFCGMKTRLFMVSAADQTFAVAKADETPERMIKVLNALRGWADVVIVDTSPDANNIHVGCYYAADYVLLPTLCTMDSINSISKTLHYLETAEFEGKGELHAAKVLGILPNQYRSGERNSQFNLGLVAGRFGREYHVFPQINYTQAWETIHSSERPQGTASIYSFKPGDHRERESKRLALRDFKPVIDKVLEVLGKKSEEVA